ncbi:MAG TPA: nucleotidyl transferase AbiEii/AbiGii toxin family protein [Bacteroidetes bacterium]|nr:nucleotidyl transferase AbiEii/AbiGii toxin family protein [Bacteroidota bacterium]
MIAENFIIEWQNTAPWQTSEQVEQDLVLSRAMFEIFSKKELAERLALRGGTALHKLFLQPQHRYSEDIDLVQIQPEPIKQTLSWMREVLEFLGKPKVKQKRSNNTLIFRFESEIQPVQNLRLKIEINCREHFNVLGFDRRPFSVESRWFSGSCEVVTFQLEELLGTKMRALYQRRKGRDLYDLDRALKKLEVDTGKVLECYRRYMDFSVKNPPSQKEFRNNMKAKLTDGEFLGDTTSLLIAGQKFDPAAAYENCFDKLIGHI